MPKTKSNFLQDLVAQLSDALPAHFAAFKQDFEKNCHRILQKTFSKFDLVTREEFDIQTKVLSRTRKKLDELHQEIKKLEETLARKN